jgi:nucleotide-binding universal stress UspA family protein
MMSGHDTATIQQILVGLDGSEYSQTALQYGIELARKFHATLHGLHVVDIVQVESPVLHDLAGSIGAAPYLNLTALMRQNLELRGRQLLDQFQQACAEADLPGVEHLATGVVPTELLRVAREVDLVILGRGGLHIRLSKALLGSAIETVVRQGSQPTMVVPQDYRPIRKPLLATDGSPSAEAALHTAVVFARALEVPLHVVHCTSESGAGQQYLEDARTEIEAAGISCHVELCAGNSHEDLVQYIRRHGHDGLFMGAFGHRRIVEWVMGSTTQYLLRASPGPIILSHAHQAGKGSGSPS